MRILPLLALAAALAACHKPTPAGPQTLTWQMSSDQKSWSPVTLPSTAWSCDDCDRYFKATVHGKPSSVKLHFASDNKARLLVNGKAVFEDFWKDGYCSEKACCDDCCDSNEHCAAVLAKSPEHALSSAGLAAFHDGDNEITWQVHQESGGSGFDVKMDVE